MAEQTATIEKKNGAPGAAEPFQGKREGTAPDGPPTNGAQPGGAEIAEEKGADPGRRRVLTVVGLVAVIGAAIWGYGFWQHSQTHVSTDDAYVSGNIVNVSPIISGTLNKLLVEEGDPVKAGQVIATLEDSSQRAAVAQAQAAYNAAVSQIPQAESALAYQQATSNAAIQHAQAALQSQIAKTRGAQAQVALTSSSMAHQVEQARQQVEAAVAQAAQVDAQVGTAQAAVTAARQNVKTAQNAANAASASVGSAQANYVRAAADEKRFAGLLAKQAVTQQQYDQARAAVDSAQSQLQAVRDQAAQAQSQVAASRAAVDQALSQLAAARKAASAAHRQVNVAQAGLGVATSNLGQINVQNSNLTSNIGSNAQAEADVANARAGSQQVTIKRQAIDTLKAQAQQAKAALDNAKVQLADTVIHAPTNGEVVKKATNMGAALSPGQTILTMTSGTRIWVTANFKETQLTDVKKGQEAEVEVDAYPNKVFRGQVLSINRATGASTALLPPDNATGNFTKVVQRVPVRIELIGSNEGGKWATEDDIRRLPQGSSVTATIDVSSKPK